MMLLADSNVWLALALSKHAFHPAVRAWFARRKPREVVLFCRSTQQSFLRLLTTSALLAPYGIPALSNKTAWSSYAGFRADKRIAWVDEPPGLETHWKKLGRGKIPSPKLWMDAYLAAFALAGGYQIVNTVRSFEQCKLLGLLGLARA